MWWAAGGKENRHPVLKEMRKGETTRELHGQGSASKAKDRMSLECFRLSDYFSALMKTVEGGPGAAAGMGTHPGAGMGTSGVGTGHLSGACGSRRCPVPTGFGRSSKGRCGQEANERARCPGTGEAPLCPWPAPHRPGPAQCSQVSQPGSPQQMWLSDHPASASLPCFHTVFPD